MGLELPKISLPNIKRIIGIVSGKGGTGKSFVAVNLAASLAKSGAKVGILDADINSPSVFSMLGIQGKLSFDAQQKVQAIEKYGIRAVSMAGLSSSEDEPLAWRGPIISKIVRQLMKETLWGDLDLLIVDFPPGSSDALLTILQGFSIDGVVLVTTPQALATQAACRTAATLAMLKVPLLGILENMRGDAFGEGGGNRLADRLQAPLLGSIPLRRPACALADGGTPAVCENEEMEMIFARIARGVVEKIWVEG